MSDDTDRALAQIKAALDAGPTPGPWFRSALRLQGYDPKMDGCDIGAEDCSNVALARHDRDDRTEAETIANAALIAACNPSNMAAIVAHADAQAAEIERLRADAERLDWLAERLQDVQIDNADPTMHYEGGEEDVAWPVLWRRAIDEARKE